MDCHEEWRCSGAIQPTLVVYHPGGRKIEITTKNILDEKHLEIEPTDELETSGELFIFGQIVDKFNTNGKLHFHYCNCSTTSILQTDRYND